MWIYTSLYCYVTKYFITLGLKSFRQSCNSQHPKSLPAESDQSNSEQICNKAAQARELKTWSCGRWDPTRNAKKSQKATLIFTVLYILYNTKNGLWIKFFFNTSQIELVIAAFTKKLYATDSYIESIDYLSDQLTIYMHLYGNQVECAHFI